MKKARKIISIIVTLCFLLTLVPTGAFAAPQESDMPFDDVQITDWFYDTVQYAYEEGLMAGTGDRIFSPQLTTTRGMIVTILHRMAGNPDAATQNFSDVASDAWYAEAVNWASESGVGSGYGGGLFGPNDPITREQMASFLYRYAELEGYDVSATGTLDDFADASSVSNWAEEVMSWAVGANLLAGRENNQLAPQGLTTRAEAATILMRYCENIVGSSAGKFTITFDYNYDNKGTYTTQKIEKGKTAKEPTAPSREGFIFNGWYTEASGENKYNFNTQITKSMTLYAKWEVQDFEDAHEEFMDKNIYDFDVDRVLQVDENDTEDNFLVVSEDVTLVKGNSNNNQVTSANESAGKYVISNISDDVRSLQSGDKLVLVSPNAESNVALNIDGISVSGNTATITSNGGDLEDFYDYIQIDQNMPITASAIEPVDEKLQLEVSDTKPPSTQVVGSSNKRSLIPEQTIILKPNLKNGNDSISGEIKLVMNVDANLNWDPELFGKDYIECDFVVKSTLSENFKLTLAGAGKDWNISVGKVSIPIGSTGLFVNGDLGVVIKKSGEVNATFASSIDRNMGFTYRSNSGYQKIDETIVYDVSSEIYAEATVGVGLSAGLSLSVAQIVDAGVDGSAGIEGKVKTDLTGIDNQHLCYLCLDGNLYAFGKLGFKITVGYSGAQWIPLNLPIVEAEQSLGRCYFSILNQNGACQFGWGECPNKNKNPEEIENLVVIKGQVKSSNSGSGISGVTISSQSGAFGEVYEATTDTNGHFELHAIGNPGDFTALLLKKNGYIDLKLEINTNGEKLYDVGIVEMTPTSGGELIIPEDPSENDPGESEGEEPIVASIHGTIREYTSPFGPLENVEIYVYDNETYSDTYNEVIAQGVSDTNGNYSIDLTQSGEVRMEYHKDGYAPYKERKFSVSKGEDRNTGSIGLYPVEDGAAIGEWCKFIVKGTIVAQDTKQPLEGVKVICTMEGNNAFSTISNSDGTFTLVVEAINTGAPAILNYEKNGYGTPYDGLSLENYALAWGNFSNQTAEFWPGAAGTVEMYKK